MFNPIRSVFTRPKPDRPKAGDIHSNRAGTQPAKDDGEALRELSIATELKPSSSSGGLAPAVFIACGAGVAFWWWSQWARAREEERAGPPADSSPMTADKVMLAQTKEALDESLGVQADAPSTSEPARTDAAAVAA